jgi:hypothetical protein
MALIDASKNSETPRSPIFVHRAQRAAVVVDDVFDCAHDVSRWNADIGKCCADKCKLLRFDLAVSRTFDFIQEPA